VIFTGKWRGSSLLSDADYKGTASGVDHIVREYGKLIHPENPLDLQESRARSAMALDQFKLIPKSGRPFMSQRGHRWIKLRDDCVNGAIREQRHWRSLDMVRRRR